MKTLLQKLVKENIHLSLNEGELSVKIPKTGVDPGIINEIKSNKQELIAYLSNLTDPGKAEIPSLTHQESYPLSFAQKRIWNLCQMNNGSEAYNIPGTMELGANLDIERFKQAVDMVIDRHEALRTVFKVNEFGEVRQYILSREDLEFEINYFDYSNRDDKEERAGSDIDNDAFIPFDLEKGPLFRASLFKMKEDQYIFYYNMHSIAADGESIEIFTREAMAFSEMLKAGTEIDFPKMKIQYKDFSDWQSKRLEKNELKEYQNYWSEHLSGDLPLLDLPNQKERPKVKTFSGKLLGTNISIESTKKLKKFVDEQGGNLFMSFMATWKVFLYNYTSKKDLIIGTPALGRDHPDLEGQIGPYINTIAVRSQVDPSENFLQFYNRVKETISKSYSFQMYPYERIVEDLELPENRGRNPIFDVALLVQREEQILEDFQLAGIEKGTILEMGIGKKYVDTTVAKYDLEIDFRELGGCFWFNINYNTDLYERDTIEELMISYRKQLEYILDNYTASINTIPKLNLLESEQI